MTQTATILVVDDDQAARETLSNSLAQAGYRIIQADNQDDAILLAREQRPGLALLDVRMGGKGSFDVAAYLRDYCRIPFMFMSEPADTNTVAQIGALGAVAFLTKPLDLGVVVPMVDEAIAHATTQRSEAGRTLAEFAGPSEEALASTSVAIAVGILMHRYSLGRNQALEQLKRLAELRSIQEHAERLIEAVELLAMPLPPVPAPSTPSDPPPR